MVDGHGPKRRQGDAESSAETTGTETTAGQKPASESTVTPTPAEGTAPTTRPAVESTNPVKAPAVPASRRGLSKLAFVVAVLDWLWTDLDGES